MSTIEKFFSIEAEESISAYFGGVIKGSTMTTSNESSLPIPPIADDAIISDMKAVKAISHALRSRILSLLVIEPMTVHQVAESLSVPFTRLYYHFHMLEKLGVIQIVRKQTILGGVEEYYYRAIARNLIVDRSLWGQATTPNESFLKAILAETVERTATQIIQSAQAGKINFDKRAPDPEALLVRHGSLALSPQQIMDFQRALITLLNQYMAVEPESEKSFYEFSLSVFPSSSNEEL
jgi:DNA-binding transcriptional ArsR family regulator